MNRYRFVLICAVINPSSFSCFAEPVIRTQQYISTTGEQLVVDGATGQQPADYNPVLETIHETTPLYEPTCGEYDPESMREKVRRSLCMSQGAADKYLQKPAGYHPEATVYSHEIPRTYAAGWGNDYRVYSGSLTPSPAPSSGPSHISAVSSCQSSTTKIQVEMADLDCNSPCKAAAVAPTRNNDNYLSVSQTTPLISPELTPSSKECGKTQVITPRETEAIVSNIEKLLVDETL